jgi:arylsulfatase A-like enzyme
MLSGSLRKSVLYYVGPPFLVGVVILLLIFVKTGRINLSQKPICPDCNIILVSIDTLGAEHLPCYGYARDTAPNLCQFAKENILFSEAYSNGPWTLPSHFSIFTSLYPKHHGMINYSEGRKEKLSTDIPTVTEILKENSYRTVFVGPIDDLGLDVKRGLGRGFDEVIDYEGIYTWNKGYDALLENNKKGNKTFLFLHTYWVHDPYLVGDLEDKGRGRLFTDKYYPEMPLTNVEFHAFTKGFYDYLINVIDDEVNWANKDKIAKYELRVEIKKKMEQSKDLKYSGQLFRELLPQKDQEAYFSDYYFKLMSRPHILTYAKDLYDEQIYYLDRKLTTLFDLVLRKELADNTILIVVSDHGEEFMEHGGFTHPADHLYNTTTKTLMTMHIPGVKSRKVKDMVQNIDIMPTVLDLLGIKSPPNIDGISLKGLIRGDMIAQKNDYLISQGSIDSIRNKKWKLYVNYYAVGPGNNYELYDLEKDPEEKNNLADEKTQLVAKLFENLNRIIYKK